MTHTERTEARIAEIEKPLITKDGECYLEPDDGSTMYVTPFVEVINIARELAAKLDAVEARIRRNDSRGIDCDVRDDLIAILEENTSA